MNDDGTSTDASPDGMRFQFSLATFLVLVTLVAVYCSLVAWHGPEMLIVPILTIGPIGGVILARVREPTQARKILFSSGLVTMAFCGLLVVGVAVAAALSAGPGRALHGFLAVVEMLLLVCPASFMVGVLSGVGFEAMAGATRAIVRCIPKRPDFGAPEARE